MNGARWTKEREAQFRKLHAEGLSFGRIAARLGVARGACAGKAHRMGLSKACAGKAHRMGLSKDNVRSRSKVERKRPWMPLGTPSILPSMPNGSNIPHAQRCTLLQLTNGICKWPFGEPQSPDFFFCGGDAIEGKPYCVGHCQVAYRGYWN